MVQQGDRELKSLLDRAYRAKHGQFLRYELGQECRAARPELLPGLPLLVSKGYVLNDGPHLLKVSNGVATLGEATSQRLVDDIAEDQP